MKVSLNDKSFDLDQNTWKVFLILNKLKKEGHSVSSQVLMAHMLFERRFGLDYKSNEMISPTAINDFEKNIFKRIEELREHKLIQGTTDLIIPEEFLTLEPQLGNIRLDSESPLDAMSIINMILPHDSYSQGIFSPYDESIFSLYRSMGYLEKGILLKISFGGKIYSCIVEVKSNLAELYEKLLNLKYSLERIGVKFLILEKLPLQPIPMFPFFTVASDIIRDMKKEWREKKFNFQQDEAKSYLEGWFKEYLESRKAISNFVENYSLIDPHINKPKEIIVFLNKELNAISTFYYQSESVDKISIKIIENTAFLENVPEGEGIPSKELLIQSRSQYAENFFVFLGDPKAAAISDIGKQIEAFNKKSREPMFDTNEITPEDFRTWIKAKIEVTRQLLDFFNFENYRWSHWKKPLKVYSSYKLDEQRPNLRRGGHYSIRYQNSDKDEILVHQLSKEQKDADVYGEEISDYKKFFESISGDLLSYLMTVKGEHFKSYF